jgi:4-diphosphocytidyl-2-C-methyl-D-erythritol kinase
MPSYAAPAKLNLLLHVLGREPDGFHQIETLFCRVRFADRIDIEPAEAGIALRVEGEPLGELKQNLVYRAALAFQQNTAIQLGVSIALHKHIPAGSGLGGGSSDAATTLRALNELHGRPLSPRDLFGISRTLGSDVPFFAWGGSLALGTGRGERLLGLAPLPVAPVVIVVPDQAVSTADAYRALDAARERGVPARTTASISPEMLTGWSAVARLAANDFESIVCERIAPLQRVRDALQQMGALIAMLTGSGSAMFGVFAEPAAGERAARAVQSEFHGYKVIVTETS